MPSTRSPITNSRIICSVITTNEGSSLPRITSVVEAIICMRSHVPHACSAKKVRPTNTSQKNANITVNPGTTCSAPLTWR